MTKQLEVQVVSASAGSGKTTRIAKELKEQLATGAVRPEAVLATTFTNKAAAELKERVRAHLFAAGQADAALRLEGARIGTVNAVCGRLVADFALELGLSPRLSVLDEDQARLSLRRVLSRVVTDGEKETLQALQVRLWDFDWRSAVAQVIEHSRANRLTEADLERSKQRSLSSLLAHQPTPAANGDALDAALQASIDACVKKVSRNGDETKTTATGLSTVQEAQQALRRGPLPWRLWAKLQRASGAKASAAAFEAVQEAAGAVDRHPKLRADLEAAVTVVFDLAVRARVAWQEEKTLRGVIDFVDQEVLALGLLERPEFAARVAEELDLVLVDEFQDTSPLQLLLFMRLAALAKRSIWVGDQKQAIFGFRGTDPALMDAAVEGLLGGVAPQILGDSWRSRPGLVSLTSELFAQAFAPHGIPRERVVLRPTLNPEPAGLGATLEWWPIDAKNKLEGLAGLADGVRRLLVDPTARVRDRETKAVRPVRAGDVAVLCRTNAACRDVAAALARHGLAATVHEGGLLSTPEGRAALLGLRLFVDPRDRAAAAELALLLEHPHQPDAWLDQALRHDTDLAFEDAGFHAALTAMRGLVPAAGPVAALDAAIEALQLREVLPRWGRQARRFANLDALRAHAASYASQASAEGGAATAAGLVAWLDELERQSEDTQARLPGEDAVVVSTWHAAKGLEWPVTVLSVLDGERPLSMFGLSVQATAKGFDLAAPLAGRWLRYWPYPFHPSQRSALRTSVEAGEEAKADGLRVEKQELRLLYVGWTRARDRLVFASKLKTKKPWPLALLPGVEAPDESGAATWGGLPVNLVTRGCSVELPDAPATKPEALPVAAGPAKLPRAWVSPSAVEGEAKQVEFFPLGTRLNVQRADMNALGQAVHGFLAADRPELAPPVRRELAAQCLERWGQRDALTPGELVEASLRLRTWVEQQWPGARWRRELAVSLRQADGSMLRGTADLVLELPEGFVLVDHKSFPGGLEAAQEKAASFLGQLDAYTQALEPALGKPRLGAFIHLPMLGQVAKLG
jgi:ATP-dependent exoDNAse (exonuclease V) beta subunit